ncbi:hypothetical protein SAMN02910398_03590 [Butyrivibrio sp. YAB3001]|nr:hypothetical protein SAMN02910398_03590 [Butyrivibrio sp. YAB3001]
MIFQILPVVAGISMNEDIHNADVFKQKIEYLDTIGEIVKNHSRQIQELRLKQA